MPPPNLDTQEIRYSLAVDQDEESVLSDSYSDRHSSTVDRSTMWSKQTTCKAWIRNRKLGPLSAETKMDTSLVKRITTEIAIRKMRKVQKECKNRHGARLAPRLLSSTPETQTEVMNVVVMADMRDHTGHDSPSDSHKTKLRVGDECQSTT